MKLIINGQSQDVSTQIQTVQDLLQDLKIEGQYFAVALNQEFIPRHSYKEVHLKTEDAVEILIPMQGG